MITTIALYVFLSVAVTAVDSEAPSGEKSGAPSADAPSVSGLIGKVDALIKKGDYREALTLCEKARRMEPRNAAMLNQTGLCHYYMAEFDEAIKAFKEGARIDPGDSAFYYNIGRCYVAKKQWDLATVYFKKAIRNNPESGLIQFALANTYFVRNQLENARLHYEKAASLFSYDTPQGKEALRNALKVEMLMKEMGAGAVSTQ